MKQVQGFEKEEVFDFVPQQNFWKLLLVDLAHDFKTLMIYVCEPLIWLSDANIWRDFESISVPIRNYEKKKFDLFWVEFYLIKDYLKFFIDYFLEIKDFS